MPNFSHYINRKSKYYLKVRYSNYLKTIFQIVNDELIMNTPYTLDKEEVYTIYKRRLFFDKEIETFVCDKSDIHKKIKGMMFKINRVDKLKNLLND